MNSDFSGAGHIRLDNKDRVCERIQEKEDIVRLEVCERERGNLGGDKMEERYKRNK